MKINDWLQMKKQQKKITMLTCYDYPSAKIVNETDLDAILVGDTLAMVVHGYPDTTHATVELMATHIKAVARGITNNKMIVGDLPYLSYRRSQETTMEAIYQLTQAGAQAVKLEGAIGNLETIEHIVKSGVPVMGHLGLTPQHIHGLGGFKLQGKKLEQQEQLVQHAKQLEAAGCFAVVLECIPSSLGKRITNELSIPTIGIGAGSHTDGQILVWHDMLGYSEDFKPKFLKTYAKTHVDIHSAINTYCMEVKKTVFPDPVEHCYQ